MEESDLRFLNKIEWVSSYAVAIILKKEIKLACIGALGQVFKFKFKSNATNIEHIISKSEIDGLRVIRVLKNDRNQICNSSTVLG